MGKITGTTSNFIRNIFARDRQKTELSVSSKEMAMAANRGLPGTIDAAGIGSIGDVLGLDRRMLHRYSDYEQMDEYGDISSALDIYADDATQTDSAKGHSVWVTAQDEKIKAELEDMLWNRINIEENIWSMVRTLSKYGNDMEEIVVGDGGVVDLRYMSPATVRRVESNQGDLLGFVQSYTGDISVSPKEFQNLKLNSGAAMGPGRDVAVYEDWRVTHMRLRSKHRDALYGWAVTEPARWVWKRLMLLEDAVLVYKLTRSPSRYAFYVDVGKLPRHEAEKSIQEVMQRIKKKKFVNPKCLTGENKVKLLDGTDRTMEELARNYSEKDFWVYSYDLETGKVVPGLARNPRLTDKRQLIYKVELDNGEVVRCNEIHPFLMRDGTYRPARDLMPGDSLMPLYVSKGTKATQDYTVIKDVADGKTKYLHRVIAESKHGELTDGLVVHHINGDKKDNRPENLEVLTASEHMQKHPSNLEKARGAFVEKVKNDEDFRSEMTSRLDNWRKDNPEQVRLAAANNGRKVIASRVRNARKGHEKILAIIESEVVRDPLVTSVELAERLNENSVFRMVYRNLPTTTKETVTSEVLRAFLKKQGYPGFKAYKYEKTKQARWRNGSYGKDRKIVGNNHKVVSVVVDGYEDVYNLDVEKYHNFLLSSGVFTHNTGKLDLRFNPMAMDEDFFLAVRDGKESTRVESLMGPSYQQVEDVQYFLHKLYAALKVPRAYMGYDENMPSKATLCIAGDTVVKLIDGTEPTIAELASRGGKFWVYSIDKDGKVCSGLAEDARLTRPATETIEVIFDDGKSVVCTPDHPVMMRDGLYKEAIHLVTDDEVMAVTGRGMKSHKKILGMKEGPVVDTFDLTVQRHHNFTVGAGVVVHNSQEDVRFARTVLRVQRETRNGLGKVAKVDLAAKNIDPASVEFAIQMTVPSSIFELAQMEVRRAQADLASMMERHVSMHWILSNVYGLSDEEILEVSKQKGVEQKAAGEAGGGFESVEVKGRGITERELLAGKKEDEKRIEEAIFKAMRDPKNPIGRQLAETGMLVRDLAHAARK